ncbi:MAG: S8 family serine peptidase [Acidimicrobiia bacterium]
MTKIGIALGSAILFAAATAPGIATAGTAAVGATPVTPTPLAPSAAAAQAGTAYQESTSTNGTPRPLVTVETNPNGAPTIVAHQVSSVTQAKAVATEAAKGNDLVSVQADTVVRPSGAPTNDTYHANQWALDPVKTSFSTAWKISTGKGITVAVIDTGVDANHPDLTGQVLPGRAFLNGASSVGVPMSPSTDTCGHGTHVAGTIAALTNNSRGVAGAAPGVKILPVKVLNCSGLSSDVANGVVWAANNGARVINLSLGGPMRDTAMEAAINYARSKKVVVVAAAGNNHGPTSCAVPGNNAVSYPGASPGVIGVGATDSSFNRACFSNTGSYVDLMGPGVSVLSTYPTAMTPSGYAPYMYMSGTSMATPHVAAAAALVLSRWPTCTSDRVERKLESTAKPLGGTVRNDNFGYGLIDPARAVAAPAC